MAIDPTAFFALQSQVQTENRLRDQSDISLSNSFMGLSSLIVRLTQELGMMTSIVSSGQRQENSLLTSLTQGQELVSKGIVGKTVQSEIDGGIIDATGAGGGMGGVTGAGGGMGGIAALLGGGLAVGGLTGILGSVLGSPGGEPGGPEDFSGSSGAEKTMSYLISQGLTPEQAAGVAGNLQQESGFNPNSTNSKSGNTGIAQWDPVDRWPKVSQYIQSTGKDPRSLEGQLAGLKWEAEQRGDWSAIKGAKNEKEAARIFLERFERSGEKPGQSGYENRMTYSSDILKKYQSQSTTKPSGASSESSKYEGGPSDNVTKVSSVESQKSNIAQISEPPVETPQGMIAAVPSIIEQQNYTPSTRGSSQTIGDPFSGNPLSTISALSMGIQVG